LSIDALNLVLTILLRQPFGYSVFMKKSRDARALLEEPLGESAPLAYQASQTLCGKDPLSQGNCSWYHGIWQYIRILGMGAAPTVHAQQLVLSLDKLARTGNFSRVFLSGSADYSLLAHVMYAYEQAKAKLDSTVVDICETPLYLCNWYAERQGKRIETVASDVLAYESDDKFDIVCAHSFLGYFDTVRRSALLSKWHQLLRPRGRVIVVQRIRPNATEGIIRFTEEEVLAFKNKVAIEAEALREKLSLKPETLEAAAAIYAERFFTYPISSRGELLRLFQNSGFEVHKQAFGPPTATYQTTVSGPTVPGRAEYAFIEAIRL
jgi:SAM-dependent methyltransferase